MAAITQQAAVSSARTVRGRYLSNVGAVLSGQAANIVVALLLEICYARILGPGPRGQISLCMMTIAFGALLAGLGGDIPIVIWRADRKRNISEWIRPILLWGILGCVLFGILWFCIFFRWSPEFLRGVTPQLFRLILLTVPCAVLFTYAIAVMTGAERFRERAAMGVAVSVAGLCSFLVLTFALGKTAEAALWGNFLGIAAGLLVAFIFLREEFQKRKKTANDLALAKGLLTGLRGQTGNVAAFFNYRLDVFVVNYFLDASHVGLYSLGVVISEGLWQIPAAAAVALFPRTARTVEEGATEFTCKILRHVLLISCATGALLAIASPVGVPLIFGARFSASVGVIWWILPGTIALALAKVASSDLAARHKTGYASAFGAVALVVTIALDFLLIPRMGIDGAAIASSAAYLVNTALLLCAVKRELGVRWSDLLVPRKSEFSAYRSAWVRVSSRLSLTKPMPS
ncbi:MAG TPA: polysaccharide biosynthesis C-terminal domain-containing protein [Candidatus Acidoferrum sp.]|nr:polysaccharide biosynthesis C-terminal domain-containing protein [Candidatus Acidoferrum sp.]